MPALSSFNRLAPAQAQSELIRCCGSKDWAEQVTQSRPYINAASLYAQAEQIWNSLPRESWLEAFGHHPRIGEKQLREKFGSTAQWAEQEQKGASGASEETLAALVQGNKDYESRFGYVFLVCATGKSADELLSLLQQRLNNEPLAEIRVAAAEQAKITRLRLEKWLSS